MSYLFDVYLERQISAKMTTKVGSGTACYNPTFAAAFSRNRLPSRM